MDKKDAQAREALLSYFSRNDVLLCNENTELPYLDLVGGTWNGIVALMESGDVFYSRLYHNRVTYLSRTLYFALKPHRRRIVRLSAESLSLLEFLRSVEEADNQAMQTACRFDRKTQIKALDQLISEMFVTVIRRDQTIRDNWCTFYYGLSEHWEQKKKDVVGGSDCADAACLLRRQFTEKQVIAILK